MPQRSLSNQRKLRLLFPSVALGISLILLSPLILPPGTPFFGDETYYIPWTVATLQRINLQAWVSGVGPSTNELSLVLTITLVALREVLGQELAVKTYLVLMAWLSGLLPYISIRKLLNHWRLVPNPLSVELASSVGGLVYLLFFNNQAIIAGSNSFVWNYAFFPILVSSFILFFDTGKMKDLFVFGVASILASPQPFWPFLVGIVGAAYIVFTIVRNHHLSNLAKIARNSALVVGTAFAFNAFWIVPILAGYLNHAGASFQLYTAQQLITPEDLSFLSFWSISDVLLMGESAHYFFWYVPQNYSLLNICIPLLAMSSILAYRRNSRILFVGTILIIGAVMTAGANSPLGFAYYLLARSLPYGAGAILRNPTKFAPIVTFAYSIMLGLSIIPASREISLWGRAVASVLRKKTHQSPRLVLLNSRAIRWTRTMKRVRLRVPGTAFIRTAIAAVLILLVLGSISYGTVLDLQGYTWPRYHPTTIPQRYTQLNDWLAQQPRDYKVMWIPAGGPYDWKPYDVTGFPDIFSSKPTVAFTNIFPSPLNSTQSIGRVLAFLGVQYVIYHNDSIVYPDAPFLQGLLAQKDLTIIQSFNDTLTPTDTSRNILPVGTPGTQFSNSPFQLSLSQLPRQQETNVTLQYKIPQSLVDQGFHGQFWDGFGILLQGFPAGSVDISNRIFFATVAQQNATSDTTGSALLTGISAPLKYPESSIDIYANFYDGSYRPLTPLFFVGRISLTPNRLTNQYLIFKNTDFAGSIFAQNLSVMSQPNTGTLLNSSTISLSFPDASISNIDRMSNVEYIVTVQTTTPFTLVFTEPYDRLWRAYVSGVELRHSPVYGLVNGFVINQTGTLAIRIYYTLQDYLNLGAALSAGAFAFSIAVLVVLRRRSRIKAVESTRAVSLVELPAEDFASGEKA